MTSGLREQKKQQTRQDLVAAALRRFAEHGFDSTTVEEIADDVGVSPRTFFRYFPSKEDVLFSDATDDGTRKERLLASLRERPAHAEPATVLQQAVLDLADSYEDELPFLLQRKQVLAATPSLQSRAVERKAVWEANVLDELRTWRKGTNRERTLELRVSVAATVAALHAAIEMWLETGGRDDLTALIEAAFAHLGHGLTAEDPGR